jgi:hypothetical protein
MNRRDQFTSSNRPVVPNITNAHLSLARPIVGLLVASTALMHHGYSHAGPSEIEAAEVVAGVITYYEKCTGDGPSPAKMDRLVRSMLAAGLTPQDFATGSQRATAKIERLYPGSNRPPQSVCTKAIAAYRDAFGGQR